MVPLSRLDVLAIDVQATAAAPAGHLLELAWLRVGDGETRPESRLVRLPPGVTIAPAVGRVTGISFEMSMAGVAAVEAWQALAQAARTLGERPIPAIAHFARFELPFVQGAPAVASSLDVVCTHAVARRLLPDLPRCSLRAIAGYFGRSVGTLRRGAEHVEATAFVWRALVRLLEAERVRTWEELRDWLASVPGLRRPARRGWPMPRDVRLAVPASPGIYRMLRTNGDVLYVGKAASLRHRVNSYFRRQHGIGERTLEMLSQARGLSFDVWPTTLEAALAESDEIKRHRAPYNIALTTDDREVWFTRPDLSERRRRRSARSAVGPFTSPVLLDQFAAFADGRRDALGSGRYAPAAPVFDTGHALLRAAHPELARVDLSTRQRLLGLGTRLWAEGRRDHDDEGEDDDGREPARWTPELVQRSLEWLVLRAALSLRRALWLTRLVDASVAFAERGAAGPRLLVFEDGELVTRAWTAVGEALPVPSGHARSVAARRESFTIARFDRLRVLTTELKRLAGEGAAVAVRFGPGAPLEGAELARVLAWV